jgi:hypothetical protein
MSTLDGFLPQPDVAEAHEITIHAPAETVYELACAMDFSRIRAIRAIFRLREKLLGSQAEVPQGRPRGLLAMTQSLGWRQLSATPPREIVMGAVTQPWLADVVFRGIPPSDFAAFCEPNYVKIVWTLEAHPLDGTHTRFRTETRVKATDEAARVRFRRYWRFFGIGIVFIRRLALPALKREAELRFGHDQTNPRPPRPPRFNRVSFRSRPCRGLRERCPRRRTRSSRRFCSRRQSPPAT